MRPAVALDDLGCAWSSLVVSKPTGFPFGSRARRHVARCLRCQAEGASHRTLRRTLRTLRSTTASFDPSDVEELLEQLKPVASVHRLRVGDQRRDRRRAVLGGVAAAATAASAGVVVWFGRLSNRTNWAG